MNSLVRSLVWITRLLVMIQDFLGRTRSPSFSSAGINNQYDKTDIS